MLSHINQIMQYNRQINEIKLKEHKRCSKQNKTQIYHSLKHKIETFLLHSIPPEENM